MRPLRHLHGRQDGLAALETALVLPVVTVLIMLIMDVGIFFFDYVSAANSVREGARCGAVGHTDAAIDGRVGATSGFSDPLAVTVDRTGGQIGDDVVVTASFSHDWILPATVFGVPDSYEVSATMRIESLGPAAGTCGG